LKANISGIEVEGTAEEIGVLLRNYLKPTLTTTTAPAPSPASVSGLTCPACGMGGFKTPATVRMHVAHMRDEAHKKVREKDSYRHFGEGAIGGLTCSKCGKAFQSSNSRWHHENRAHGVKPPKGPQDCPDCGTTFRSKQGMEHHRTAIHGTRHEASSAAGSSSASDTSDNPTADEPQTIKHYIFVCKVGPTEVRHEVSGKTPNDAIKAHDEANPNHRFLTALNRKEVAA
jgi:uncharacterized C2H2 Zn-finger protein